MAYGSFFTGSVGVPTVYSGKALNYFRVNAAETDIEFRTPAEVLADIGGLASAGETAAALLAKIVTVDGAGSGLDADLLDGLSSAAFATAVHSHTGLEVSNTPAGGIGSTTVQAAINELDTEKLNASSYTAADVLAKLLTVDGSGSGLDADVLRGTTPTAFGLSLIDDVAASNARTTLGLVIGTDVQAFDAELAAIAGLTSAADRLPYFTGSGTAALATYTAFARTLDDDVDATAARSTLGVVIGTNVQAWDADLDALAALTGTNNIYYRSAANTWTSVTVGGNLSFSSGTLNVSFPAWTSDSGTVASGTGTITTASGTARYLQVNKTVFVGLEISVTDNGTGASFLNLNDIALPAPIGSVSTIIHGMNRNTGIACRGEINSAGTVVTMQTAAGAYPVASGQTLVFSGCYEAA